MILKLSEKLHSVALTPNLLVRALILIHEKLEMIKTPHVIRGPFGETVEGSNKCREPTASFPNQATIRRHQFH